MFGIYSGIVNRLPAGRLKERLSLRLRQEVSEFPDYLTGTRITHDTTSTRLKDWRKVLSPFQGLIRDVLEVGSYEGQSALFWLNFFNAKVTCIDDFAHPAPGAKDAFEVEANFDHNVGGRVRKIKSDSTVALHQLAGEKFDLIYIDGDHSRDQVMIDSLLAWRLLRSGGLMIWDDYVAYQPEWPDRDRPASAVNHFISLQNGEIEIIKNTGQQLFAKRK